MSNTLSEQLILELKALDYWHKATDKYLQCNILFQ